MIKNEFFDKIHEGFVVICRACDSDHVFVSSDLGFSSQSGSWGSVSLECNDCGASVKILGD